MNNWGCATGTGSSHPSPQESPSKVFWERSKFLRVLECHCIRAFVTHRYLSSFWVNLWINTALIPSCNLSYSKYYVGAAWFYRGLRWELLQCEKGLSGSQPLPGAGQKPPPPLCAVAESQKDQMFRKKKGSFCAERKSCCQSRKHCLGIVKPLAPSLPVIVLFKKKSLKRSLGKYKGTS